MAIANQGEFRHIGSRTAIRAPRHPDQYCFSADTNIIKNCSDHSIEIWHPPLCLRYC